MCNYLSIFKGILSTDGTFFDVYMNGLDEHRKFDSQTNDESGIMQHINSLLTTSSTRVLGLRLLDKFVNTCSIDALEKKGNLWTTLVLKACNTQELLCEAPLIFNVLNKVIKRSQYAPDFTKSFISTHISTVYESLQNVPSSESKYALRCIETCLRVYPGASGPSRGVIERALWKNIDDIDYETVKNSAKCLHLLQQVKVGGVQGVSHKTQWKNYQLQLVSGIHSVYNDMFTNFVEMYEGKVDNVKLPWGAEQIKFDSEPVKKAAQMYTRCRNLVTYLNIALIEPFPVEKPILVKKILDVVIRGLNVNCEMLEQSAIADNIALSILLPNLHIDILNLLNVAVKILQGHLRPYSELILDLMVGVLKWTSAKDINVYQKTFLSLRTKAYDTVSLWCKVFYGGNRSETIAEYLFQEIISDIISTPSNFTLKILNGARKHMSKKARRQLQHSQNDTCNMGKGRSIHRNKNQHLSETIRDDLCISALFCLQGVIFSVGNFVKPTILKTMHTSLIQISATFYELTEKQCPLYSNKKCRLELYNALYAILMTTHCLCPPPTELILAIIQTAYARDDSLKVRTRCGFILQNFEKIIHPQKESLLFPIEARDIRNTFTKMGQENLLHQFEFNYPNFVFNNDTIDDKQVMEPSQSINFQFVNTSLSNRQNDYIEYANKSQANNTSISENNKEIQNKYLPVRKIGIVESTKNQENNDAATEMNKNQMVNNDGILPDGTYTTKIYTDLLGVDDDVDIATVNKEDVINGRNPEEPITKKQKHANNAQNETDMTEYSNIIKTMDHDDDYMLAEIASQFIDELE